MCCAFEAQTQHDRMMCFVFEVEKAAEQKNEVCGRRVCSSVEGGGTRLKQVYAQIRKTVGVPYNEKRFWTAKNPIM